MKSIRRRVVNCNSYAQVPPSIQRTAIQQSQIFLNRWSVDLDFSKIPWSTSQINAKFQEMIPCRPWQVLFHHGSSSRQILPHDSVSVIVSRFTKSQFRLRALLISILPNFAVQSMASPERLLHRVRIVLAPPAFRNFGLSRSECEFFSCYTFPHGNSGGNGFLRACSSSCDRVCNRSPCACSLIFSHRNVAGHLIKFS